MEVHPGSQVLVGLPPQELLDELVAVFQVVAAAAPLPSLTVLQVGGLVAGATLHPPRTACLGHGVRQPGRGDGVQEGCLLKTCRREEVADLIAAGARVKKRKKNKKKEEIEVKPTMRRI